MQHILLITAILGCSSDDGLKAYNTDPSADITSHEDGDELLSGYSIIFKGSVSDVNHNNADLKVTWLTDNTELCPEQNAQADGSTTCTATVSENDTELKLQVVDPAGAAYVETINITVLPTEAPTVEILSPIQTETYYADQLILFSATINDAEDDPADLIYTWSSSIDGDLALTSSPDSDGGIEGYLALSAGQHALSLRVEDTSGKSTTENVAITVGEANTEPLCSFILISVLLSHPR